MRVALGAVLVSACLFAADDTYVGSDRCRACHPDVTATFFRNAHAKKILGGKEDVTSADLSRRGCESCHGPGKTHVDAKGGKTNIVAFSQLTAAKTVDQCLACHSQQFPRSNIRRSPHTTGEVGCSSCHSIHNLARQRLEQSQLARLSSSISAASSPTAAVHAGRASLAAGQPELCYGCHQHVRAQFSMPFKHRVNEGFMQCTDCHNPHGVSAPTWRMAARPKMVDQALINEEACLKCHVAQRGPFAFEHAATRVDGCESCHTPHGSANARLLKRPAVFTLCLECHNGAPGFGRDPSVGVPIQSPSHSMTNPRYQNCTACHVRIHGSNADARFLR